MEQNPPSGPGGLPRLLFLPSPWVGAASWGQVPALLNGEVVRSSAPPPTGLVEAAVAAAGEDPVVLVPHSNAGLYVPMLAARLDVRAVLYVDAALAVSRAAAPTAPTTPAAPPELVEHLRSLAAPDGTLPPWTTWWDDVGHLFPGDDDGRARALLEAEQPRLPLHYAESSLPTPAGWERLPSAYLAFGDTYAEEQEVAESWGWPHERLTDAAHLHMLVDPHGVDAALRRLLASLLAG